MKAKYTALESREDVVTGEVPSLSPSINPVQSNNRWASRRCEALLAVNATLLLTVVILLVIMITHTKANFIMAGNNLLKSTSIYSPIFDFVDLMSANTTTINGKLFTIFDDGASKYTGPPSADIDAAWDFLSAEGREIILVDESALSKAGYDSHKFVRAPTTWGSGNNSYPVQIDVFHQIHCLDQLRKQMHSYHYFPNMAPRESDNGSLAKEKPSYGHWHHMDHCLQVLLQNIMCHSDVDMIPHRWVENVTRPYAEFSIRKQCRNFNALRQWNDGHSLRDINAKWNSIQRLPQDFVWPGYGEDIHVGDYSLFV